MRTSFSLLLWWLCLTASSCYEVDPSGALTMPWPDLGIDVVGAGVSTCAPLVPE